MSPEQAGSLFSPWASEFSETAAHLETFDPSSLSLVLESLTDTALLKVGEHFDEIVLVDEARAAFGGASVHLLPEPPGPDVVPGRLTFQLTLPREAPEGAQLLVVMGTVGPSFELFGDPASHYGGPVNAQLSGRHRRWNFQSFPPRADFLVPRYERDYHRGVRRLSDCISISDVEIFRRQCRLLAGDPLKLPDFSLELPNHSYSQSYS